MEKQKINKIEMIDAAEREQSLLNRISSDFSGNIDKEKAKFIERCMSENLNHARHVENERITFNSVFMAMTAGAMAFLSANNEPRVAGVLSIGMFFACVIAFTLTIRWSNAFDRHLHYAMDCYVILHNYYFNAITVENNKIENASDLDEKTLLEAEKEKIGGLNEYPLYCFKIRNPIIFKKHFFTINTKKLYYAFYTIILVMLLCSVIHSFGK